jgi:TetR/AcrR family transcriptional regulator, transcriptional repressor for nem operon
MARPKAFEPEDVLERAMHAFWRYGYEATSTQILERELGINRSSIYATFGSKSELYHKALRHYTVESTMWAAVQPGALDGDAPLVDKVSKLLWRAVEADMRADRKRGCFAVNAAVELAPDDREIRDIVSASIRAGRSVFRDAFVVAQRSGELRADADPDALASLMMAVLDGLHVFAKGTANRRLIKQAIEGATAALR